MTTHSNGTFRRGALAATAIAGLAINPLFSAQVHAQTAPTATANQGSAACAKAAKGDPTLERAMRCESREMDRRIAAAKQQGVDADRRAAEADRVNECASFLIAGIKKGIFTKAAVTDVVKGKVTAANACEAARSFGFNQKAELNHPAVQ